MDEAHDKTDKELKKLEQRISEEYDRARKELQDKLDDYLRRFAIKDDIKRKLMEQGKLAKEEYTKWRYGQICVGKRWQEMRDSLAKDLSNANQIAMGIVREDTKGVYALNHNFATFEVETKSGVDTSYTLYDRATVERLLEKNRDLLPQPKVDIQKDLKWNRQKIQSAITQGILQGESLPKVASRLQQVTDMNRRAAIRNARTATTGAQNAGRSDSYKRAKEMGIGLEQVWMATLDGRTRHSHRMLDGEAIGVGDKWHHPKFSNGCRYPGDPQGRPSEVYNCRCTMIAQVEGSEPMINGTEGRNTRHMKGLTYDEWKNSHKKLGTDPGDDTTPPTFAGKIQKIRERIAKNGGKITEADLMEAGKYLSEDIGKEYAKLEDPKIASLKEKLSRYRKEYDELGKRIDELNMAHLFGEHKKYGFASDKELQAELKKLSAKWAELADLVYGTKLDINKLSRQQDGILKGTASADRLKNKLSEIRGMGSGDLNVKKHLKNTRSQVAKFIKDAYDHYPTDWVEKSINRGELKVKKVNRGYYYDYYGEIAISGYSDDDCFQTAIHELGHRMERALPGLREIEQAFYDRRTKGEELKWLGKPYRKNEVSRKDKFLHPYMGKDYGGTAFELVSMGFEIAYTDPLELAKDPDMEAWIYGILCLL